MKVLHYITDFTAAQGPMAATVRRMMSATSRAAETCLVTCTSLSVEQQMVLREQYGISVFCIKPVKGRNPLLFRAFEGRVKKVLKEVQPDVVHVHGTWDFMAAMAEWKSRHCGFVTVVSPHRGLSPEILNIDFWSRKFLRLAFYQVWMIRNCTSVIAVNDKEREDLLSLSLKKRIEVMPVSASEQETDGQLRDALLSAYRKALDSMYFKHLTEGERSFVFDMVRKAVVDEEVSVEVPDTKGLSFRRIYFYAYDEDVTDLMAEGVRRLQIVTPPLLDVVSVPRYKNRKAKKLERLTGRPCDMVARANAIGMKRMTLRQYVALYQMLRHEDFDEDAVAAELKQRHLLRFTRKMQKRLAEMFSLTSGYNII